MGVALKIRDDLTAEDLRREARREQDGRASARMHAIANALEGASRAEAARLAGMERQALRDAVLRYNGEGLAGLHDRSKGRPQRRLDPAEEAALSAAIMRGPDPAEDGCCAWTRADLCRWLEAQRHAIHAVTFTRGGGSIVEHMSQVPAASRAVHFRALHEQTTFGPCLHSIGQGPEEARPAGAALELGSGFE